MERSLREMFEELTRQDGGSFRSEVIRRLCPELHEATEVVNNKLEAHYMKRFEEKGF